MATGQPLVSVSYRPLAYEISPADLIHWSANIYSFPEIMWKKTISKTNATDLFACHLYD